MNIPQFKSKQSFVLGEKLDLNEVGRVNYRSRMVLYVSKLLLLVGIFLIVLDNLDYVTPGSYFGSYGWTTITVLSIGIFISFLFVPYLYFSSFRKFKENDEFWDEEVFWILPLFFFGTFFQYGSGIFSSEKILLLSMVVIFIVHFRFMLSANKLAKESDALAGRHQYLSSLAYLTVYYLLFLGIFYALDPVNKFKMWMQL